jgi:hypothetical protein
LQFKINWGAIFNCHSNSLGCQAALSMARQ